MVGMYRLCQFVPSLAHGDAVSNQTAAVHRVARSISVASEIYVFHPSSRDAHLGARPHTVYEAQPGDIVVLHYGGRASGEDWVIGLPGRKVIYYHNVTPYRYYQRARLNWAEDMRRARETLPDLSGFAGVTDSAYNKIEMERMGFHDVRVIPLYIDLDALARLASSPQAQDVRCRYRRAGGVNWLHVGRIATNKCIEDIIRSFAIYHTRLNPNSRLFLVGSDAGFSDYARRLREWADALGLSDSVVFAGHVSDEVLGGYYLAADAYVCMSEHEGFCVPLVEAMYHRLPIIAFRSTGVMEAMGNSGLLVSDKDPRRIAAEVHAITAQPTLKERVIAGQIDQLQTWHPDRAVSALRTWLIALGC